MEVFDNIIDETEVSNFQDSMKKNFTDTVPSLLRSLCAGLVSSDEYLIAKNNLSTIRSNRLTAATFDTTSVNITDGSATSKLLLGSELRGTYENWNCSNSGLLCTELCVGTVLVSVLLRQGLMFTSSKVGKILFCCCLLIPT